MDKRGIIVVALISSAVAACHPHPWMSLSYSEENRPLDHLFLPQMQWQNIADQAGAAHPNACPSIIQATREDQTDLKFQIYVLTHRSDGGVKSISELHALGFSYTGGTTRICSYDVTIDMTSHNFKPVFRNGTVRNAVNVCLDLSKKLIVPSITRNHWRI